MNAAGQVWNAAKGIWESVTGGGGYNPQGVPTGNNPDEWGDTSSIYTPTSDSSDWGSWIDNWSI
jgi:hypothetical protein